MMCMVFRRDTYKQYNDMKLKVWKIHLIGYHFELNRCEMFSGWLDF